MEIPPSISQTSPMPLALQSAVVAVVRNAVGVAVVGWQLTTVKDAVLVAVEVVILTRLF